MPQTNMTLKLDQTLIDELERRAESVGLKREDYAEVLLDQALFSRADFQFNEDPSSVGPFKEEQDEDLIPAKEVLEEFERRLNERLAAKS